MKSYLSLVNAYGKVHKNKTRITVFCIAIAVCLVTAIFGLAEAMIQAQTIGQIKSFGYWHVAFKNIDDETATSIGSRSEVETAGFLSNSMSGLYQGTDIAIMGGDEMITSNMGMHIINGNFPQTVDEALLDEQFFLESGISLNDRIEITMPDGNIHNFIITGTYENTSMQLKNDVHGLFLSYQGIQTFAGDNGKYSYYVQFKDRTNMRNAIDTIKEDFHFTNEQAPENPVLLALSGQSLDSSMVNMYLTALILFILVLVTGTLMIASSFNTNVKERIQFFGLIRCLGASTSQVKRYVLLESLRLCLLGIPIGLMAGTIITIASSAFLKYANSTYFADMPVLTVNVISLICGTLVGLLTVILAALSPAKKAAKISPQCAVSGNTMERSIVTSKPVFKMKKIKAETALGISHAFSDKKNIFLMTGSFAISIILFLSFSLLVDFMGQAIRALRPYTPDISIASADNSNSLDKDILEQIKDINGVKNAYGRMFQDDLTAVSTDGDMQINLISYEENQFDWAKQELLSGNVDDAIYEKNTVLVDYENNNNWQVDDTFIIKTADSEHTVRVGGTLSSSPFVSSEDMQTIICSEQTFQAITGESEYTIIDTQLTKQADEHTVSKLRSYALEDQKFFDRREDNSNNKAVYYSFAIFIYGFLIIICSITIFNIINSMNNSVSSRINRYGVMRAIGMTGKQLHRMVVIEAGTYTICGCLTGLLISLPIHKLLYRVMITSRWGLTWNMPFGALAIIIAITVLSTIFSVIAPVKKINKMSVVDVIGAQ